MKKQIPSKTSNFADLISQNGFYVDKTKFIEILESISDRYLFFLRPRRFGKSLLLSTLQYYYGIEYQERFNELFSTYYIGENPTPLKNSYYILNLNFSGIKTQDSGQIEKEFNSEVYTKILSFLNTYKLLSEGSEQVFSPVMSSPDLLRNFFTLFRKYLPAGKIYILIDEYDHFTNELFSFNKSHFQEVVSRNGWVRKFYEVVKQYMGEGVVDRFFATGVTPVTLDSMTSGFNVARNITLDQKFNNMAGFSENELYGLIANTIYEEGKFDIDDVIVEMRAWYNGSLFSPDGGEKLYNPQMVVTFLSQFKEKFSYPREMADINVTSDFKKISNILSNLSKEDSDSIIEEVYKSNSITESLTLQYNFERPYTKSDAVSLLFYHGLLTIQEPVFDFLTFVIPNYVIKQLYWEFLRKSFESDFGIKYETEIMLELVTDLIQNGKIDRLFSYAQNILKILSVNDFKGFGESQLKVIMLTILSKTNAYLIESERETRTGFPDIILNDSKIYAVNYQYAFELKYVKQTEKRSIDTIRQEGIEQLRRYKKSPQLRAMQNLRTFLILFYDRFEGEFIEV